MKSQTIRVWKTQLIQDEFTDLKVSRQRKWQLRHPKKSRLIQKRYQQSERGKRLARERSRRYLLKIKERALEPMNEITPAQGKKAFAVHQNILELKRQVGMAFIEMGKLLKELRDNRYFEVLGYDTFTSYIINSELGFKRRTAYYYVEIYEWFVEKLGYDMQVLAQIGYDKLMRALDVIKKLPKPKKDKVEALMTEVQELRPVDFAKKYKDEKKQKGFKDFLPPPEYMRCDKCEKWIIVVPIDDCCPKWLILMRKKLDAKFGLDKEKLPN